MLCFMKANLRRFLSLLLSFILFVYLFILMFSLDLKSERDWDWIMIYLFSFSMFFLVTKHKIQVCRLVAFLSLTIPVCLGFFSWWMRKILMWSALLMLILNASSIKYQNLISCWNINFAMFDYWKRSACIDTKTDWCCHNSLH